MFPSDLQWTQFLELLVENFRGPCPIAFLFCDVLHVTAVFLFYSVASLSLFPRLRAFILWFPLFCGDCTYEGIPENHSYLISLSEYMERFPVSLLQSPNFSLPLKVPAVTNLVPTGRQLYRCTKSIYFFFFIIRRVAASYRSESSFFLVVAPF